jgi:proteic killer suppression protein
MLSRGESWRAGDGHTAMLYTIEDVNFPGSDLHQLKGKMKGYWAVRVSGNWRLVFRFEGGHAREVDYGDYH